MPLLPPQTPSLPPLLLTLAGLVVTYTLMIVVPMFQIAWYRYENARRDRMMRDFVGVDAVLEPEFTDKTDFEQWETYRYIM